MKEYQVDILSAAERQLKKLPHAAKAQAAALLDGLARNPRPRECKQLQGPLKGYLRVRSGNVRVIYQVNERSIIVTVVAVGDRRDIYG